MLKLIGMLALFLLGSGLLTQNADAANPRVRLTTNHGDIVLELNAEAAPNTVENFLSYVREGFYDKTIFHRVIQGFMIQGGGIDGNLQKKESNAPIQNEADNGLSNIRGSVAMARTSDPHSAGSQFFINTVDNLSLDHKAKNSQGWGYCVFGNVVEGMEVVSTIEKLPTTTKQGWQDTPVEIVSIEKAVIE